MSDHGFNKTVTTTNQADVEAAAREISTLNGVVAVHLVKKKGADGHPILITLGDEAVDLREVIARKCARHKVGVQEHESETWLSLVSFRNGKRATNAFI